MGFTCRICGEWHDDFPLDFHANAPIGWTDDVAGRDDCELTDEVCIIAAAEFYVRGLVRLPIIGRAQHFARGVWVSLSTASFGHALEVREQDGRENSGAAFGWLSTALPTYGTPTVGLKTMVHTQPVGVRPHIEVEPTDHPLAVEQHVGLTWSAVVDRVEQLLHLPK